MDGIIDKKIQELEEKSIQAVQQENVFKRVMDDDEFKVLFKTRAAVFYRV